MICAPQSLMVPRALHGPAWQLRRDDLPEVLPKIHEESLFLIEERGITFEFTDTSKFTD